MNTNKIILTVILFFGSLLNLHGGDFKTIYDRMYKEYTSNPSKSGVESVLNKMNVDGSFSDINYQDTCNKKSGKSVNYNFFN